MNEQRLDAMKRTNDKSSLTPFFSVMGIVIIVFHASGAWAAGMNDPCQRDPDHTLQQLIESKAVGSDRVPKDIESALSYGLFDIKSQGSQQIWRNRQSTRAFYWPVLNEQFILYSMSCRISCTYRIEPKCVIYTPKGNAMFAFRHTDGTFLYVLADDFEMVPSEQENQSPPNLLQGSDPFGIKKVPSQEEHHPPRTPVP